MASVRDGRSPRTGDRVRAVTDNRDAEHVEGILHIRHVPSLHYAQVTVITDVHARPVAPGSIEVVVPGEIAPEELERSDPLVGEPGRRRLTDLAMASDAGLLSPPRQRMGGTWADLLDDLATRAAPMLEAGWRLISTDREESWEFGDTVFYDLERDGTVVELEFYEHGQHVAYDMKARSPESEESSVDSEPIFSIPDSTAATALEAFRAHGWV